MNYAGVCFVDWVVDSHGQMEPPQAVFLDVGWTLIYPRESLWEIFAAVGADAGTDLAAETFERIVHGMMSDSREKAVAEFEAGASYTDSDAEFSSMFALMGQAVFGVAGVPGDHGALTARFVERFWQGSNWQVFPDVVVGLKRLRAAGIRVGVLSNAASDLLQFLQELGLLEYCDFTVVSALEGIKKPDRRIFDLALERAGVAPHRAVHVGDMMLEDVLGARNAGVSPLLMDRGRLGMFPNHPQPADAQQTVPIVRTLDDVVSAIGL